METQKINISIVILNWNGKTWLEKFLPILLSRANNANIFIIDNASSDNSVDYIKNNFPSIKLILNKFNEGFAKGYNDALKQIDSKYYVLLNSDIEVGDNWLAPIIDLMESNSSIAACQPKILDFNDRLKFEYAGASGGFIDNLGYPFCRGRIFKRSEIDNGQYNDSIEIFWATGACLFLRASYFWEVGGFDDDFFAHQEEIDLCWRLKNKGYKIMVEPKSFVYHVGGATLDSASPFKTYLNFRNNHYMLFKNLPLAKLFIVTPTRLILDGLAALSFIKQDNGIQHFLAIAKAHFSFYFNLPKLILKRIKINQKSIMFGYVNYSILYLNKVKKIIKYSDI
jgi:hypothetical protein